MLRRLCRKEAQRAVGRVPLRDVLRSLQREGLIVRFRVRATVVEVHAPRTLPFLFDVGEPQ